MSESTSSNSCPIHYHYTSIKTENPPQHPIKIDLYSLKLLNTEDSIRYAPSALVYDLIRRLWGDINNPENAEAIASLECVKLIFKTFEEHQAHALKATRYEWAVMVWLSGGVLDAIAVIPEHTEYAMPTLWTSQRGDTWKLTYDKDDQTCYLQCVKRHDW